MLPGVATGKLVGVVLVAGLYSGLWYAARLPAEDPAAPAAATAPAMEVAAASEGARPQPESGLEAGTAVAALPAEPLPEAAPQPAPEAAPEAAPESARPDLEAAAPGEAPRFDVVRVAPDGAAVVAGVAEPGSTVTVYAGGEAVATAEATPGGEFVAIFRVEPTAEPRALTLAAEGEAGHTVSAEAVLLVPPAPTGAGAPEPPEAEIAATAVLRPGEEIEAAPTVPSSGPRQVALASISYAELGIVTLAGLGSAGATVRAYVDGAFAEDAKVDPAGRWTMRLAGVATGIYKLRVDEVRDDGSVASRVETPFQRDLPRAETDPGAPVSITVQPGSNLWTIARSHYGRGTLYSQIFTANAELIRDPDEIYPGQIFVLPEVEGAAPVVLAGPRPRP